MAQAVAGHRKTVPIKRHRFGRTGNNASRSASSALRPVPDTPLHFEPSVSLDGKSAVVLIYRKGVLKGEATITPQGAGLSVQVHRAVPVVRYRTIRGQLVPEVQVVYDRSLGTTVDSYAAAEQYIRGLAVQLVI